MRSVPDLREQSLADLRDEIESAAQDQSLDAAERQIRLDFLRERLIGLLGAVDTYLSDLGKLRQAQATIQADEVRRMYENAAVRDDLIERGVADPRELDEAGYYSLAEVENLKEEGLLEEVAAGLAKRWQEKLHPRARGGKFTNVIGPTKSEQDAKASVADVEVGGHVRKTNVGGHYAAVGPKGEYAIKPTQAEAEGALSRMQRRQRDSLAGKADPGVFEDYETEPFGNDPEIVTRARELILSGNPTTRDKYSVERDGKRVYDSSRAAVHRRIIDSFLEGHEQTEDPPKLFFTGGAFASGKGGILKNEHEWEPKDALTLDPDKIKAEMPEFVHLQEAGDPEANLRVYEEAWDISQALAAEARERGINMIVDGVGNTSSEEVLARVKSYTDAGYDLPKAVYAATPTEVAITNAQKRMEGAIREGKVESIRYIPPDVMRDVHGDVSKVFPDILKEWPGDLELYDTNTWDADTGTFGPPVLILRKTQEGGVEISDEQAYQAFLDKAKDSKS